MNGVDGVVLAVIQITDDRVPNGRHLRVQHTYGAAMSPPSSSSKGEGEVDGDPTARRRGGGCSGSPAGLRRASARERGVAGEEGGAQGLDVAALPSPHYI